MEKYVDESEKSDLLDVIAIYGNQAAQTLPKDMLGSALRALKLNPLQKEIDDFIISFDKEGNGLLTLDQLAIIYSRKKKDSDTLDQLLAAFKLLDRDGSGNIGVPEFRYYMCRMGELMPEADVDEMIKAADPENTGKINSEKFAKVLMGIKE
jgi:calmodulin